MNTIVAWTMTTAALAVLVGCGPDDGIMRRYIGDQKMDYQVNLTETTPKGAHFDPSGQHVSGQLIDRLIDETEDCLRKTFGESLDFPPEVVRDAECHYGQPLPLPLDRDLLQIKIPNDWVLSCDGNQQLLKDRAPDDGCLEKVRSGQMDSPPTEECPCRWRAGLQDGHIIVVTPSLYVFKDPLVRYVTGCRNPWRHPKTAACMRPTVPKLPDQ